METQTDIIYCVAAFIDLQGFSSHLEISSDLRTTIGKIAIERLDILEKSLQKLKDEEKENPQYFPNNWESKRINDSLLFTTDLPESLLPYTGNTIKSAMSSDDWEKYYEIDQFDAESFDEKYSKKRKEYTSSMIKFIGLVARIHQLINIEERNRYFPGAKTIISTGFRRRYKTVDGIEDMFSANFAFSNAYMAQEKLKGGYLFLDNNILEMMDSDIRIQNIAKLSCLTREKQIYSPLEIVKEITNHWKESKVIDLILFRKTYFFRKVNPNPLTYLQFIDDIGRRKDIIKSLSKEIQQSEIDSQIIAGMDFNILKIPYDLGLQLFIDEKRNFRQYINRFPPFLDKSI